MGILQSGELWLTNIHFLNDWTEYIEAHHLLKQAISRREDLATRSDLGDFLKDLLQRFGDKPELYIFSLSAEGDLLSQWRGYCPGSLGFAIGFDAVRLSQLLDKEARDGDLLLGKCRYEDGEKEECISALLDESIRLYDTKKGEGAKHPAFDASVYGFLVPFARAAGCFKNVEFSEESEWRVISVGKRETSKQYSRCFRRGRVAPIPYRKLKLWNGPDGSTAPIKEIRIGPASKPDEELTEHSLRLFRNTYRLEHVQIERSRVPYRTFGV